ncbi:MAG: hypothetical protein WDA06_07330 [Phenylobacterium sp.]
MDNFEKHLNNASKIVSKWPAWKRNCLGNIKINWNKRVIQWISEEAADYMSEEMVDELKRIVEISKKYEANS